MEVGAVSGATSDEGKSSSGLKWGWNPLTDFQKGVSGIGDWVDAHTGIGSFNPGIGHLTAAITNALPGLANMVVQIGREGVTGDTGKAMHMAGEVGTNFWHGIEDTGADILTAGGLAPWTNTIEEGASSGGGYRPNTLKQYATNKEGPGLGGALFNDAANLTLAADGAGALARSGGIGKAAVEILNAEKTAMKTAVDAGGTAEHITEAGSRARIQTLEKIAEETPGDTQVIRARLQKRLQTLEGIEKFRDAASLPLQPWRALRPLNKAAAEAMSPETPVEAAEGAEGVAGIQTPGTSQGASQGPSGPTEGQLAARQAGADEVRAATTVAEEPVKPGYQRIYNAGPASNQEMWTPDRARAESYADGGPVRYVDLPEKSVERLQAEETHAQAREGGHQPTTGDVYLGAHPHWNEVTAEAKEYQPRPNGADAGVMHGPPDGRPVHGPPELVAASNQLSAQARRWTITRQLENVPRAYTSYIENAKPTPRWAKQVVDKLPEPVVRMLAWGDAHHQKIDYQRMTREQNRALAVEARRIEHLPEVKALKDQARQIIMERHEGVSPTVASNIVGQLVRAFITKPRELIEALEGNRPAMEEAMVAEGHAPGTGHLLVDAELGYAFHIPDELNTPEFRQRIFELAEPIKQLRQEASARMRQSDYLKDKGLEVADDNEIRLTKNEMKQLNQARHKLLEAAKLEQTKVPRELAGKAREKAAAEDAVGKAMNQAQVAMESAADARTEFDRTRYVPQAIDTPEKLAVVTNEIVDRTLTTGGATYNPTTGHFIGVANGTDSGYVVGALAESVHTMPLDQFQDINPETGRTYGAETLDHLAHGYQEALQFPNMTIGTFVDADGQVHFDVNQYLEGANSRDHALTLAAVRGQKSVLEVGSGTEVEVQLNPNASAYYVKTHAARDLRGRQLREISDRQVEAGGRGMTEDEIDSFMAFTDMMGVQQHLLHPETYKTADSFYSKGFKVEYAERASSSEGALNEIRVMLKNPQQIGKIVRPMIEAGAAEARWYYLNHDYIEKIGAQLPDVQLGLNTPWSNARVVSGKDLLYSLVAVNSINNAPGENMANAVAAFRNMTKADVRKLAKAIKEWAEKPQAERTPSAGKWADMPEPIKQLTEGANQISRRQMMAIFDGHTLDTWDSNFIRETFPNYGNKEAARLPIESVTDAERAALAEPGRANTSGVERAIMEHFGSSAQAKLRSFWENLYDPENSMSVTLDAHMARAFGAQDTFWNGPNWFKHAEMIRGVARDLSAEFGRKVAPHEVQAALWYWVKTQHASVQVAAQRANILDNIKMIENGTWTAVADKQKAFFDQVVQEAHEQRPEGALVEKRKMRFADEPLKEGKGRAKERTVDWRRTAAKTDGTLSSAGKTEINKAAGYDKVLAEIEGLDLTNPNDVIKAKASMLDWLNKQERALAQKVKGEHFWSAEHKIGPDADVLGVDLPGALNEMRDDLLVGQFVPGGSVTGGTIRLFKGADIGTLFHEGGHLLRALTTGDDLKLLERTYGVEAGKWNREQEEDFVHDFLAEASEQTTGPMSRLKQVLADAYGEFGGNLHPEIDGFWQKVLAPEIEARDMPGYEMAHGERIIGVEGMSEAGKSFAQRQRQGLNMQEAQTKNQMYTRGKAGEEATEKWRKAVRAKRDADQAAARAQKHVENLEKVINERLVPSQQAANLARKKGMAIYAKLAEKLEDPSLGRVPAKWQPMVGTAQQIAKDIEKYPILEPILRDFPQTFAHAMDYAKAQGFLPEYMPDMTPQRVQQLIAGTARLGNEGTERQGRRFISGARKNRTGTLQRLGAADQSIEAVVAGLNEHVQEARTNMVVDWIDRVAAKALPVDAAGRRLGAPTGWVEWDPIRQSMLAVDTAGGERVAVGATKMIPRAVANAIKEYAGPAPTNPIYRGLKSITDPWRRLMLTLNPGFYLRHFQGHVMLAAVAAGGDLKAWGQAWKAMRSGYVDLPEVTGLNMSFAEAGTPGLVEWPSIKEAFASGGTKEAMHLMEQKAHKVIGVTDAFARAVAYFAKKNKGYSEMEAMQYAMDAVIDYGDLSNTEKYMARAIIPFYAFEKGVLKIAYRMPMDHPLAAALMLALGKWQEDQAVDDDGNPLPERYQGVVDLPLLGPTDMQRFTPFKDLEALTSPEGLVSSLQFAVQDVVRAGLGVPGPGTKATTKVDKYGRLVPDVSLSSQLPNAFMGGPQGQVLEGGSLKKFFGLPVVDQETINKAGARNILSLGEQAAADKATQEKAVYTAVNTQSMQLNLQQQLKASADMPLGTIDKDELQKVLNTRMAEQQARSQQTRRINPSGKHGSIRKRRTRRRLRRGFARRA